jgi:hypothetical protein
MEAGCRKRKIARSDYPLNVPQELSVIELQNKDRKGRNGDITVVGK